VFLENALVNKLPDLVRNSCTDAIESDLSSILGEKGSKGNANHTTNSELYLGLNDSGFVFFDLHLTDVRERCSQVS
jgi:hypothetical protein